MKTRDSLKRGRLGLAAAGILLAGAALAQVPPAQPSAAGPADIRDIRGPKPLTSGWWLPILLAGGVAAVGGGYATWVWRRRRALAEKSPEDIALARLEMASALIQDGGSREYSIELSSIVRQYIEDAFHIVATHLTTDEFLHHLAHTPDSILASNQELLRGFLQACDLSKFGGWHLTTSGRQDMLESARRFICESAHPRAATMQGRAVATNDSQETYDSLPST
jgi:hypothetical protein